MSTDCFCELGETPTLTAGTRPPPSWASWVILPPGAAVLMTSPRWSNQVSLVRLVAERAPVLGCTLKTWQRLARPWWSNSAVRSRAGEVTSAARGAIVSLAPAGRSPPVLDMPLAPSTLHGVPLTPVIRPLSVQYDQPVYPPIR